MNTPMPDAPPNAMMGPQGGPQALPSAMSGAPPNMMMGAQPQQAPRGPVPTPPTPDEINQARKHSNAIVSGLLELTSKPKGDLTKDDVFKAASEMIAKGAFPTSATRQGLVVELAKLPDDEPSLRKALGMFLLQTSAVRSQFHALHGAEEGGAPNAGI